MLNHVHLHKHINYLKTEREKKVREKERETCLRSYLVEVSQGLIFSDHHLGEFCSLLRVNAHHISQEEDIVRGVANLLGVQNDLLELTRLRKTLDDLQINDIQVCIK